MSMRDYLQYMTSEEALQDPRPLYLWDDSLRKLKYEAKRHPLEDTEVPAVISGLAEHPAEDPDRVPGPIAASITMGPACTGSHFHQHGEAFCVLTHGLKYWNIANPEYQERTGKRDPDLEHPTQWLKRRMERTGPEWWRGELDTWNKDMYQGCTQRPGDLIYVPRNHAHMVINLWPSAAINHELATLTGVGAITPDEKRAWNVTMKKSRKTSHAKAELTDTIDNP